MTDNLRWLIALAAAGVTMYTLAVGIAEARASGSRDSSGASSDGQPREQAVIRRRRTTVAVVSLLVFWSAAQIPPFGPWTPADWTGLGRLIGDARSPEVLVACLVYLGIVVASSRGLIGMPIYRQLQARASELRELAHYSCFEQDRDRLVDSINRAERIGARRIGHAIVQVPLPDVLGANRTLNAIEKQMLSNLESHDLRLAATQIAAMLPANPEGTAAAETIARAITVLESGKVSRPTAEGGLRNACASALILLHRQRDVPQEREVNHIRVSIWLTMVGLAATYALSVTWPGHEQIMIAGALGGLLGSLSALLTNREVSLGMVVLSPVAGALNALGGSIVIGFLAQDDIQVLGQAFRGVWSDAAPTSVTALAVAVLLGFSGGLFSRIAVAGTAPLLGGSSKTEAPPAAALAPAKAATVPEQPAARPASEPASSPAVDAAATQPESNGRAQRPGPSEGVKASSRR